MSERPATSMVNSFGNSCIRADSKACFWQANRNREPAQIMIQERQTKELPEAIHVALAEALTWIAFRDAMSHDELRLQVEGAPPSSTKSHKERLGQFFSGTSDDALDVPGLGHFRDRERGLERLSEAWRTLREAVEGGYLMVRGRPTASYSLADAALAERVELTADLLATFSQFDVSTGGIRRQPQGSPAVLRANHPRSYGREFESFGNDKRAADGFLFVKVERAGLLRTYPDNTQGTVAANRQLDHDAIIQRAAAMLAAQSGLSLGSAAASIVAELPPNLRTGKPRDHRGIERIIVHLWNGGLSQSPP